MKKRLAYLAAVAAVCASLTACQQTPVQSICNDAPRVQQQLMSMDFESPDFQNELMEDAAEYAADYGHCPEYQGQGEEEE